MNIVKPLKGSSLPPSPKKSFRFWIKGMLPTILFSCLVGTYLDLFMVGLQRYTFPIRPFSGIFSINVFFTLVGLPLIVILFLHLQEKLANLGKAALVLFISVLMSIMENVAEVFGLFAHAHNWNHIYTLAGYGLFLSLIYLFHNLVKK